MLVRRLATQGKRPSKGDDADSRNNGEWAFRTACAVRAGSRMMDGEVAGLEAREVRAQLGTTPVAVRAYDRREHAKQSGSGLRPLHHFTSRL